MKGKVNTVKGEINVESLGSTLCHEHVACVSPFMRAAFGDGWMDRNKTLEAAAALLKQVKETCGIDSVIDGTPLDLGRDAELIAEASELSGVNIVISTGLYCVEDAFIAGEYARKSPEFLAEFFIRECESGVRGCGIKPGILKCATGVYGVTDKNRIALETMAIVQKRTGLPLFAHNSHNNKTAFPQLEVLKNAGADLHKVIVGHASDSRDPDYLEELLKKGCYLGFDRIYSGCYAEQAATMAELMRRGYGDKLLVSHDYYGYCDIGEAIYYGGGDRDMTVVGTKLFPELIRLGISDAEISKLTRENVWSLWR